MGLVPDHGPQNEASIYIIVRSLDLTPLLTPLLTTTLTTPPTTPPFSSAQRPFIVTEPMIAPFAVG